MWQQRLGNALSLGLGFLFMGGGISKLFAEHAFPGIMGPVWLEDELTQYGLGIFAAFVGYSEAVIGYLLFTLLLRTLGAVMLVPMLVNILMVTISLHWRGTPYVVSAFLLMNGALLVLDRERFLPLFGRAVGVTRPVHVRHLLIWGLGLLMFLVSARASFVSPALGYVLAAVGVSLGLMAYYFHRRDHH